MKDWLMGLGYDDRITFIPLCALCLLLIVVPLFGGGSGYMGQFFLLFLAGPLAYFAWRGDPRGFTRIVTEPVSMLFVALIATMALSLTTSGDRLTTFLHLLHWIAFYVVFISARIVVDSPKRRALVIDSAIISGVVLSLIGLYLLLGTHNFGYLRLSSAFGDHNAFGGFLLIPFVLLLARTAEAKSRPATAFWSALLAVVGGAFFLTFSRGNWLSLAIALLVVAALFWRQGAALMRTRSVRLRAAAAMLALALIVSGTLAFVNHRAGQKEQSVEIFSGETLTENALVARLHYFDDALVVFKENPLFGVGLSTYGEAVKRYKDTPAFYTSTPHNEFLRMLAELGLLGGILFALLMIAIVRRYYVVARATTDDWLTGAAVLAGGVATLLASSMEISWGYAGTQLVFFAIAGAVYGGVLDQEGSARRAWWGRVASVVVVVTAALISLMSVLYWYESNRLELGIIQFNKHNYVGALSEFREANRLVDFDFSPHYFAATTLEKMAHITPDPVRRHTLLQEALREMQISTSFKPMKPLFHSWQASLYKQLGDTEGYRRALETTILYNPVEAIDEYSELAMLYMQEKEYAKTVELAEKVLRYYPLEMYQNPYWVNPFKKDVWAQVALVAEQLAAAYTKTGDTVKAKEALELAKRYRAAIGN